MCRTYFCAHDSAHGLSGKVWGFFFTFFSELGLWTRSMKMGGKARGIEMRKRDRPVRRSVFRWQGITRLLSPGFVKSLLG